MSKRLMNKVIFTTIFIIFLPALVYGHCEIPCGIYGDEMRYDMLHEHAATIEKSMRMIKELSKAKKTDQNYNQLVRWINNKEEHAIKFMEIVYQYFLAQRIKNPGNKDKKGYETYITHLKLFHEMLITAMKCKQTVELANATDLSKLVDDSRTLYFKNRK